MALRGLRSAPARASFRSIDKNHGEESSTVSREREERRMRKLMMAVALAVVLVLLFATAALAAGQIIQCTGAPCYGGKGDDRILERIGNGKNDVIVPTGGDDLVLANRYTNDTDVVKGGGGFDKINVADGDTLDTANGGKGRDICIVDSKKEAGTSCATIEVPTNP
jgi:hypothetical protein